MFYDENLITSFKNEFGKQLPEAFPGLTKLAYEQIIKETVAALPKNFDNFNGTEEQFETMIKEAGWWDAAVKPAKDAAHTAGMEFAGQLAGGAGKAIGAAGIAALAGGALLAVRSAYKGLENSGLRPVFEQALHIALHSRGLAGENLRDAPIAKVKSFAETIFTYAPHVACDPNLLQGVLAGTIAGDSIDVATIRSLVELEEKRKNMIGWKPADLAFKG